MLDDQYVAFNSFDLNEISPYFQIDSREPFAMPKIEIDSDNPARGHGAKVVQKNYREKPITVNGHFDAPDRTSLDIAIRQLKYYLINTETSLDLIEEGVVRTYTATLQQFNVTKPKGQPGFATVELVFMAYDPFGSDISRTIIDFPDDPMTAATHDNFIEFGGGWVAEPILQATLNSGTGLTTNKTMTIGNPGTGQSISVTRDWAANDVLQIDSSNRAVTVNNVPVDYVGVFPEWDPVMGIVRYSDNFTTRSVTLTGSYFKRYL